MDVAERAVLVTANGLPVAVELRRVKKEGQFLTLRMSIANILLLIIVFSWACF